jgi:hypothetical protein
MYHLNIQWSGKEDLYWISKQFPILLRSGRNHSLNNAALHPRKTESNTKYVLDPIIKF